MRYLTLVVAAAAVFATACEDPAANKPKATTAEPSTASAPANSGNSTVNTNAAPELPAAKGEGLAISPENSKIGFIGSKVTGKHDGGFNKFTGLIDLVNNKAEESSVTVDIDMTSVFTDAEGLTEHLQTDDFFSVAKFPKAKFASTKIVPDAAKGGNNFTVTGDLEMRGVKRSVTFPAMIAIGDSDVAVNAEFAINRKDFGIAYDGQKDNLINDNVV
ncbi:MAG: YceI family protein, partial [Pyrinomonadaceae bacterium]|nr:YceI family protein [Pyrinomonadaceae bacterium]